MAELEHELRELRPVLELARRAASAPENATVTRAGRARIAAAAIQAPKAPGSRIRAVVVLAAALGALAMGVVVFQRSRPLGYEVLGAESSGTVGYVGARANSQAELRFSDGSRLFAAPGARIRVEETEKQGARILVEKGTLSVSIQHRSESSWRFGAGPYEVRVTGTKFQLSWDPERAEIDLRLDEGSVEVESSEGPKRVEVRAGQRFHASAREKSMRVESVGSAVRPRPELSREPAGASPLVSSEQATSPGSGSTERDRAVAQKTARLEPTTPRGVGAGKSGAAPAKPRLEEQSWPELARRGRFGEIVVQAKARGIETCLRSASAEDLRALADAARYAGDTSVAQRSLETLRTRFSGSPNGRAAAFLLGRILESRGNWAGADRWYRVYLRESPHAELSADALAGRMRVASSGARPAEAKALAAEYLGRYPHGVDVELARKLAGRD